MTRNLKTLGLVLVAVLALSAMAASGASAKTAKVKSSPGLLGHDIAGGSGTAFTSAVSDIQCGTATYPGSANESTITVGLQFSKCLAGGVAPATVTDNGCAYKLTLGTLDVSGTSAPVQHVELECPPGKQVEIHTYTDAGHIVSNCTLELPPQTPTHNLTASEQAATGHLRIHGTVEGITSYRQPGNESDPTKNCAAATTQNPSAILHIDMTVTSTNGKALDLVS